MLEFFWGRIHQYFTQSEVLVEEIVEQTETELQQIAGTDSI